MFDPNYFSVNDIVKIYYYEYYAGDRFSEHRKDIGVITEIHTEAVCVRVGKRSFILKNNDFLIMVRATKDEIMMFKLEN